MFYIGRYRYRVDREYIHDNNIQLRVAKLYMRKHEQEMATNWSIVVVA